MRTSVSTRACGIEYSQKYKMTTKLKKATDEKVRKRKNNILKKGDELWLLCGVDVYILLHRKGRYLLAKESLRIFGRKYYLSFQQIKAAACFIQSSPNVFQSLFFESFLQPL